MLIPDNLITAADTTLTNAKDKSVRIVTAESCTGGMIAMCLTAVPGSSAVYDRGFVTYDNEAKQDCLGIEEELLQQHGAVSGEVAEAMAKGALENAGKADIAVSATGVAGPGGGTSAKPVGLVYIGYARRTPKGIKTGHKQNLFEGERHQVRTQTTLTGLSVLNAMIKAIKPKSEEDAA